MCCWICYLNCSRHWTLLSKITSRGFSTSRRTEMVTGNGLPVTWHLEVLLVPHPSCLFTLLIMPVLVLPMILRQLRKVEKGSSMVLLMFTRRLLLLMELLGFTVVSTSLVLESLSTVVCTSDCMIPSNQFFSLENCRFVFLPFKQMIFILTKLLFFVASMPLQDTLDFYSIICWNLLNSWHYRIAFSPALRLDGSLPMVQV